MRYFKKLIYSLLVTLTVTVFAPAAISFIPETLGIEIQAADSKSKTVYITPTGKKYHARKCGRGTFRIATLSDAASRGLTACKKCY